MMKWIKYLYLETEGDQILTKFKERRERMTLVRRLLIDPQRHLWMIFKNVKPLKLISWPHTQITMRHFGFYRHVIGFEDSVNFLLNLVMATAYMVHHLH